jgi:spermidine synthase
MTDSAEAESPAPRCLPLLLALFLGSGCAALIYEIVWLQQLQLVVGSSAVSLAVLLGTFMGGMCLGSLALARVVSAARHPLRVYAALELGIAVCGVAVFFAMPGIARLYLTVVGHGLPGIFLRGAAAAVCLLPPTLLMGATLPALARWVESTPRGIAWLGYFYGGNTAGAVAGCLLAGFYLLRVHDLKTTTWCAVALNLVVAGGALLIAGFSPHRAAETDAAPAVSAEPDRPVSASDRIVLGAIALSGLCALSAEVVWTRLLALMLGATVYTFSIILAVFLAGLGLGSSFGAMLARDTRRPRFLFGLCQLLQVVAITWAAQLITRSLPFWPIALSADTPHWIKFQLDLVRCGCAILPSAFLWGASFPLALASVSRPADSGRLVGRVYAANTLGAIIGAVLTSLLLLPALGTTGVDRSLVVISALTAMVLVARRDGAGWGVATAAAPFAALLALTLPPLPWQLVAYGRQIATGDKEVKTLFLGEGINATVAVTQSKDGARYFHVSGKTEASSLFKDMRLQRMLGHIPALLHPEPRSVLIVGCGAGVTAGSFTRHPSIKRIVICEIEPLIPSVVATHFAKENYNVVHDRRVEIVYDDARHFLATTPEKFDIITSDPIHPWVKGSAVLYTQEYFELCRQHLNPGGFVTQWVPFYESSRAVVQSEIATFFAVFPHGTIWGNDDEGYGYDTVVLGQEAPLKIDMTALAARLDAPEFAAVKISLADFGLGSMTSLLSTYAGRAEDLATWLRPAEINRDGNLRLQYLAGLELDSQRGANAYGEMLGKRHVPEELFIGTIADREALKLALMPPR